MLIDANVYWFPEVVFEDDALMQRFLGEIPQGTVGAVREAGGRRRITIERPAGCPSVDYIQGDYRIEPLLAALKDTGVDKAVLKVPCCHEWMSLEMCRLFNDGMAAFQRDSGGVLNALAVVPPDGTPDSLAELERCKDELQMHGVQLCAHYGNKYLDDESFAPLFEKINALSMTAYVHHTPLPVEYSALAGFNNLRRSYGRCNDQMIAVSRELFSGMFAKYPNVKVVHSMLGGGFFAYLNMMLPQKPTSEEAVKRFDDGDAARGWLRDNIFFEMSHAQPWGSDQLTCAVRVLGADKIVYGSSYPVRAEWMTGGAAFVRGLDISNEEKEQILWKNAARLYTLQ